MGCRVDHNGVLGLILIVDHQREHRCEHIGGGEVVAICLVVFDDAVECIFTASCRSRV